MWWEGHIRISGERVRGRVGEGAKESALGQLNAQVRREFFAAEFCNW
jgi:hypothetical protein